MYALAVSNWGVQPSEYWRMSPRELGEIMRYNTPPETHNGINIEFWDELHKRSNGEGFI